MIKKKVDIKQIFDIIPPCKKLHYLEKDDMSGTFNLGNNAKIQQQKCYIEYNQMLRRNHIIRSTATRNINADSGCGRKPPEGRRKL